MEKSKDQQLLELEQKVKLLERKNSRLEKELEQKDMKADFFDMMIDIAEKEYNIKIRKTPFPSRQAISNRKSRKYKWHLSTARDKQTEVLPSRGRIEKLRERSTAVVEMVESVVSEKVCKVSSPFFPRGMPLGKKL